MDINNAISIMNEKVKNQYARCYLAEISGAIEQGGTYGLKIQLAYVLENSSTWKGEEAREVKKFVKQWIKDHDESTSD
jgi:hypothetical protein